MNERLPFHPLQAQQVAEVFNAEGVEYLFIGKDRLDLHLLELFRLESESRKP